MLQRLSTIPGAARISGLQDLLKQPERIPEAAASLITQTRLGDQTFVEKCLAKTPSELAAVNDPLLQLMRTLYPEYLKLRELDKTREGKLNQLYGSLIEIKQQFLSSSFVPDANATLRFTSGHVRAYSPADAVLRTPVSTLKGVIEKTTGIEPFVTPEAVLKKYAAGSCTLAWATYLSQFFMTPTPPEAIPEARY
jgi:hypothetical protein